jgi:hypothetical protein
VVGAKTFILALLLLGLSVADAWAGSVAMFVDGVGAPAVDLIYENSPIDRDQAVDLISQGVDISVLEPAPSDAWQTSALTANEATSDFPADGAALTFQERMPSANGMLRSRVSAESGDNFQLIASLDAHAAMARSALLRKLGYPVSTPKRYAALTIKFQSIADREAYLDSLSDSTLTARKRWVKSAPDDRAEVTLQDVVLERSRIDVPMYHWGIVAQSNLKGRRVVRALIVPLALLDINESVNLFSWEAGKIVNNAIVMNHAYSDSFAETTYQDGRWIARKLAALTRQDWESIIKAGGYPDDVAALLVEKAVARRDHIVDMFDLKAPKIAFNRKITTGAVKKGKLTQADYDGYALRFSYGDPDSPLRASEIWRYLLLEGLSTGVADLAKLANSTILSFSDQGDVLKAHQQQLLKEAVEHHEKYPGTPYSVPLRTWGGPLAGYTLSASRNVVTGTYNGSDSKVQLVDSLSVGGAVGWFAGLEGIKKFAPTGSANLIVQKNFLHVRPVADMKNALKTDWKELFVPGFMESLVKILQADPTEDQAVAAQRFKDFLDKLKDGEMIVVTDALVPSVRAGVSIPIPIIMNPALAFLNPSAGASIGSAATFLNRVTLLRTGEGVQVYVQDSSQGSFEVELSLNWFVNVARFAHTNKTGAAKTKAFLLNDDPGVQNKQRLLGLALKALLKNSNSELLEDSFQEYKLKHDLSAVTNKFTVPFYTWVGLEEAHRVKVQPPDHPEAERTLFSHRMVSTRGFEAFTFFSDAVSLLTKGYGKINAPSGSTNPANAFMGHAIWTSVESEAETTESSPTEPMTTIEQHYGGWILSKEHLDKILDILEGEAMSLNLDRHLVRRDEFGDVKNLEMYEILGTLLAYPSGIKHVSETIYELKSVKDVVRKLIEVEGERDLEAWCKKPMRHFMDAVFRVDSWVEHEGGERIVYDCLKPWMKDLLKARRQVLRREKPLEPEEKVKLTTKLMRSLNRHMQVPKLLAWLGKENFFFQIKVSGFRTNDENGDSEYISDSVGTVDPGLGAGVFKEFGYRYDISSNELYARYLSEGY